MNKINKKELKKKLFELEKDFVTDPVKIQELADRYRAGFRNYSLQNTILIFFQYPGATLAAGFKQWNQKGRKIKAGEKALYVLAPYYKKIKSNQINGRYNHLKQQIENEIENPEEEKILTGFFPVPVFAYEQTEGEPLDIGTNNIQGAFELTIEELSKLFGIPIKIKTDLSDGSTDGKTIWISERKNKLQMIASFFHELMHIQLGHCGERKKISRDLKEIEAEAGAYLVCSCVGIDNQDAKIYIGGFNKKRGSIDKLSAHAIIREADKIIQKIYNR